MTAIVGGIVASVCFAVSSLCASVATREVGPATTLAGVMAFGLILVLPPTVLLGDAGQLSVGTIALMGVIGATNVIGLRIEYRALRRGKVGVVVPIVSTDGAIAAVIAVLVGLQLGADTAVLLAVVSVGVVLAAASPDPPDAVDASPGLRSSVLALIAAVLFGVNLYVTGHVGAEVSLVWVLLPARLVGTAVVAYGGAWCHVAEGRCARAACPCRRCRGPRNRQLQIGARHDSRSPLCWRRSSRRSRPSGRISYSESG